MTNTNQPKKTKATDNMMKGKIFIMKILEKIGASEEIRTLDIHLGKVTLYQTELRSLPKDESILRRLWDMASPF